MLINIKHVGPQETAGQTKCFVCGLVFSFHNPEQLVWDTDDAFDALSGHVESEHEREWAGLTCGRR